MGGDNGWISVDERRKLPTGGGMKSLRANGDFDAGWLHNKTLSWMRRCGSVKILGVTHWQDPPAPPKDPADEELEGIVRAASGRLWRSWAGKRQGHHDDILRDTLAEIKAWRDKHKGEGK